MNINEFLFLKPPPKECAELILIPLAVFRISCSLKWITGKIELNNADYSTKSVELGIIASFVKEKRKKQKCEEIPSAHNFRCKYRVQVEWTVS